MKNWFFWLIAGVISLIGGLMALANPLAATLTAEKLAGWCFILVGVTVLLSAFGDKSWGARILAIFLGAIILLLGFNLVAHPLRGVISLTYLAAILMLISGAIRVLIGFGAKIAQLRWTMLLSGGLSIVMGAMILSNFPQSAVLVLGLYLAIDLISNGISLITLSLTRKSEARAES